MIEAAAAFKDSRNLAPALSSQTLWPAAGTARAMPH